MKFFFDTSALVKFFHVESGSEIVTQIMEHPASEIWISELARLEFRVALEIIMQTTGLNRKRLKKGYDAYREKRLVPFFFGTSLIPLR